MKKYLRYILPVCLAGSLCTSCTDFFETDSDGVLKTEGQRYQDETTARVCSVCCKVCNESATTM